MLDQRSLLCRTHISKHAVRANNVNGQGPKASTRNNCDVPHFLGLLVLPWQILQRRGQEAWTSKYKQSFSHKIPIYPVNQENYIIIMLTNGIVKKSKQLVPVTVLTGFLGSGKTTLLNHILNNTKGWRVAVIENEFGDVGIDDSLISKRQVEQSHDEIIEMMNGCICCTVRKDLQEVLEKLLIIQKRPLDAILIETTGMADPAPVAQTFFVDEMLKTKCYLDAIITVVDSKHIEMQLSRERPEGVENEAEEQLCFADKMILNKVDLVPERSHLEKIINLLRSYNPMAEIIEATNSVVPMEKILGLNAFSLDRVLEKEPGFLEPDQEHMHDSSIISVCVTSDKAVSVALLEGWIGMLLQDLGADLFRYKGVLNIAGINQRYVFQGVQMMFTGTFTTNWEPNEVRRSNFVFIGRNLPVERIKSSFHSCEAKPLRFKVGTRVLANVGGFKPGYILKQWDEGNAYRVKVDDHAEVWAPIDDDNYIKALI